MATSVEPRTTSENSTYVDFDEYVDFQVSRAQHVIRNTEIYTNVSRLAAAVLLYILGFVVLDHWAISGGFSPTGRGIALGILIAGSVGWLLTKVAPALFQTVSMLFAARAIESSDRSLQSHLLNLVDLRSAGKVARPVVQRAMEKRAAVVLSHVNVDDAIDRRPLFHSMLAAGVAVLLCLFYAMLGSYWLHKSPGSSIQRLLIPFTTTPVSTQTKIENVSPGNVRLLAGELLAVEAEIQGKLPESVEIQYTTTNREFVDQPVVMRATEPNGRKYRGLITGPNGGGLVQDLRYVIIAGDARSLEYAVDVVQPPSATVDQVKLTYPAYMRLRERIQDGGHLDTWEGVTVTVSAHASQPVKSALVLFHDGVADGPTGETVRVEVTGETQLTATWTLQIRSDGTYPRQYSIQCTSPEGDVDPRPTRYNITLKPDLRPALVLQAPTENLTKPANAIVPLRIRAADDFELDSLTVHFEKDGELVHSEGILKEPRRSFGGIHELALEHVAEGKLKPGDELVYWIEARDNRPPHGQRTSAPSLADRLTITIADAVSEEDAEADLAAEKEKQQQELDARKNAPQEKPEESEPEDGSTSRESELNDNPEKSEEGGDPAASDSKPGEEGNEPNANPSDSASESQPSETGEGDSERDRPADDQEALQKLLERQAKEQKQRDNENPSPNESETPDQKPGEEEKPEDPKTGSPMNSGDQEKPDSSPDGPKSDGKQPDQKPQKNKPQEKRPNDSGTGDMPEEPGEEGANDGKPNEEGKPDDEPMKNPPSEGSKPSGMPGGSDPSSDSESSEKPNDSAEGTNSAKSGDQKNPDSKAGTGSEKPSDEKSPESGQPSANEPTEGEETPADESPDAVKRKADGNEKGVGTPEKNPDGTEPKAKNPIERKPGTKPEPNGKPRPKTDDDNPTESVKKPGMPPEQNPDGKPASKPNDNPPEKNPGEETLPNETPKGDGRPDQKSKRPDTGEGGGSTPQDDGTSGSNQPGKGDDSDMPGDQPAGTSDDTNPQGKPGKQPGTANEKNPGKTPMPDKPSAEGEPNAAGSSSEKPPSDRKVPGEGTGTDGKKSNDPNGETSNRPASQSDEEGTPSPEASSGGNGMDRGKPGAEGSGEGAAEDAGEEANLEYAKEATNLVLKRLKNELERGEVDQDLLKELGWTEDDLKRFTDRVGRRLTEAETAEEVLTPEAASRRRQFEAMLESIQLTPENAKKVGRSTKESRTGEIGSRNIPVPAEYRELYEAYTKGLAGQSSTRSRP